MPEIVRRHMGLTTWEVSSVAERTEVKAIAQSVVDKADHNVSDPVVQADDLHNAKWLLKEVEKPARGRLKKIGPFPLPHWIVIWQ